MAQTRLDVINQAIDKAGGDPIASLDENTPLAVLASRQYDQKKALMLSAHRWVFAKRIAPLTRLAATPADCPRAYAFQRPQDLVGQVHDYRAEARDDALKVSCLQVADYIAADSPEVWVEYTADRGEETWPAWFVEVVALAFGEVVATARQRRSRAAELRDELNGTPQQAGKLEAARILDSQNAPKRTLEYENGGALIDARLGGGFALNDSRFAAAVLRSFG